MTSSYQTRSKIRDLILTTPKIDIHEHLETQKMIQKEGASLATLLPRSYVGFFDFFPGLKEIRFDIGNQFLIPKPIEEINFLQKFPQKDILNCFKRGIHAIYDKNLSMLNQNQIAELEQDIARNYNQAAYYYQIFEKYNITDILCDLPYNILGTDLKNTIGIDFEPKIRVHGFFRMNSLLFSFDPNCWNEKTNLIRQFCNLQKISFPTNFDDFLSLLDQTLLFVGTNSVAVKCASAYERTLDFGNQKNAQELYSIAKSIFNSPIQSVSLKKQLDYGNYIFHYIMEKLRKSDILLQIHTGTAIQPGSHPQNLEKTISQYPEVKFDLLHFGYPWTESVLGLLSKYENVYSDFTWIPQLDAECIQKLAFQLTEKQMWHKIMAFGGDCACIEGSIGALDVLMDSLAITFAEIHNLSHSQYLPLIEIEEIVHSIFALNPKKVFKIAR